MTYPVRRDLDAFTAERLLGGSPGASDDWASVAEVLAAVRSPATPEENEGASSAASLLAPLVVAPAAAEPVLLAASGDSHRPPRRLMSRVSSRLTAVCALAFCAVGGSAVAAATMPPAPRASLAPSTVQSVATIAPALPAPGSLRLLAGADEEATSQLGAVRAPATAATTSNPAAEAEAGATATPARSAATPAAAPAAPVDGSHRRGASAGGGKSASAPGHNRPAVAGAGQPGSRTRHGKVSRSHPRNGHANPNHGRAGSKNVHASGKSR
ncbi:MAG TPA: hypothetical protein VHA73_16750 [Acidimicrobiales bacterium]|jgi:hypothetical protein|nr:hypothetical protein [Acidimicrobiales bacterium]